MLLGAPNGICVLYGNGSGEKGAMAPAQCRSVAGSNRGMHTNRLDSATTIPALGVGSSERQRESRTGHKKLEHFPHVLLTKGIPAGGPPGVRSMHLPERIPRVGLSTCHSTGGPHISKWRLRGNPTKGLGKAKLNY